MTVFPFTGERLCEMFGEVRECRVFLTELAMTKPANHVFTRKEIFFVERNEDHYGSHHYKGKVAVMLTRRNFMAGNRKNIKDTN